VLIPPRDQGRCEQRRCALRPPFRPEVSPRAEYRIHESALPRTIPALAPWREEFVREFCEFPKGKFSDQVDATTQLLDHASEFAGLASVSSGERAIAAIATGRTVNFNPRGERGIVGVARYGRPAGPASAQGPIISIKTEVKY
jgi:hypothetical protein